MRLRRTHNERKPRVPHVTFAVRAIPVARATRRATFVARASSPWLAVSRERRSYSTDTAKAQRSSSSKERVARAIACIDGVPSIGADCGTHGLEAHATFGLPHFMAGS